MGAVTSSDKLLGQSRYGGLASDLRQRILRGEWSPGSALPAEAALARASGVALGTMRQALSLLVSEGLLERRHGQGTFVTSGLDGATMMRFFRFGGATAQTPPRSRILSCKQGTASSAEAAGLGLVTGSPVLRVERLRSVGDTPCLLEHILLPRELFEPLAALPPAQWDELLYPMYLRRCGVLIHRAVDQLSFDRLNASQARRLQLEPGHPCARVQRRAHDLAGRCVELRDTLGDAFSFEYTAEVR